MKFNEKENKTTSVLLLTPLPPPVGGIATWTKNFIKGISNYDVKYEIIDTKKVGGKFSQISRTLKILSNTKKALKQNDYDIVHINSSGSKIGIIRDYFCAKKAKKKHCKVLVHFHCNIQDQIGNSKLGSRYLKKILSLSDFVLTLNKTSRNFVNAISNVNQDIMPNFIDSNSLCDYNKQINDQVKEVLFVGRVVKEKGINELIAAAKTFADINFNIVGPYDNITYKSEKNIHFLGSKTQKEVFSLLKETDVFILPTYSEGFSVAILEAMSYKIPIITTDVGANKDMLENHGGILIKKESTDDLINAIEKIKDKTLRNKMSKWNFEKVKTNYTSEIVIKNLFDIYKSLSK